MDITFKPELLSDLPWEEKFKLLKSIHPSRVVNSLGWESSTHVNHTIPQLDFTKPFPQEVTDQWTLTWTVLKCGCFLTDYNYMFCTKHNGNMLHFLRY